MKTENTNHQAKSKAFGMSDKFTLEFSLDDFISLSNTITGSFYSQQDDRFECHNTEQFKMIDEHTIDLQAKRVPKNPEYPKAKQDEGYYMYWVGSDLNSLIALKILRAAGHKACRLWDLAHDSGDSWVLLCDFKEKG